MKYNKIIKYKMSKPTPEQWCPNFFIWHPFSSVLKYLCPNFCYYSFFFFWLDPFISWYFDPIILLTGSAVYCTKNNYGAMLVTSTLTANYTIRVIYY